MPRTHLVVGANRGIGLGLVEEILKRSPADAVYATTRNPAESEDLQRLASGSEGHVVVVQLDMVDEDSIKNAVTEISKTTSSIDEVIVNGGVALGGVPLSDYSAKDFLKNLEINVIGPHNVIKAFVPLLQASTAPKRVLSITSSAGGSIGAAQMVIEMVKSAFGRDYNPYAGYFVTKSAVNMLARQWAMILEPQGIAVAAFHPGSVDTRMASGFAGTLISVAESATGVMTVLDELDLNKTKQGILSYDGTILPW